MQSLNVIFAINMLDQEFIFVRVIEAGSIKKSAEELNIEPSTVSRKIAKLEARLGVKLFHRSTVKIKPTEAGQSYYNGIKQIIEAQRSLELELFRNSKEIEGHLRIASTVDLGDNLLAPLVSKMLHNNPKLSIELILGADLESLTSRNIDVAIRIGKPLNSNLFAKFLGRIPRVLVASQAYLEQHGEPKTIQDLKNHRFVFYSKQQAMTSIQFENEEQFEFSGLQSSIIVNSLKSIKYFVNLGFGINWGPRWAYEDNLKNGSVSVILPQTPVKGFELNALYTTNQYLPYKTRWFINELEKAIENVNQLKWI